MVRFQIIIMDSQIPPRKRKPKHNRHLRKMVNSLVTNLESFQDDLLVVLDGMKDLVDEIDNVSSKLDETFGKTWTDENENIPKSTSLPSSNQTPLKHHYVNVDLMPTIRCIEERINSKLCSKQIDSAKKKENVFSCSTATNSRIVRPNSFTGDLRYIRETDIIDNCATSIPKSERLIDSLESPMLDLSYLGINQTDDARPKWGRSISLPIALKSPTISSIRSHTKYQNHINDIPEDLSSILSPSVYQCNPGDISGAVRTPTAVCYAELKRPVISNRCLSSCASDDVFQEEKMSSPVTGTTVRSPTTSSMFSNISIDGDLYERKLDDELENILDTSEEMFEISDESMDTGSNAQTETSDNTDGRYDTNTWTSFTFNHLTDSTRSSESFVSDTPSDIMNDNIWPPSNIGNLFSNSMLSRKLNVQLDNEFCCSDTDVKLSSDTFSQKFKKSH